MHSFVFELGKNPIKKENWLSDDSAYDTILTTLGSNAASEVASLTEGERAEAITNLVCKWLPCEMFETNADGTFTYTGGIEEWVRNVYIPRIKELASLIRPDKVFGLGVGSAYEVEKAIKNPLDLDSIFVINHGSYYSHAMRSGDFIEEFVKDLAPGDRIYVGAVFDYHF